MARRQTAVALDLGQALAESYIVNDQMNQVVLEYLEPRAWRAKLPGTGHVRSLQSSRMSITSRRKWLRLSDPHLKLPAPLDRARCTREQARAALPKALRAVCEMLISSGPARRPRRNLSPGWVGEAVARRRSHVGIHDCADAHHRGQAFMLAHQLGFPLPAEGTYGIWVWEKLLKSADSAPAMRIAGTLRSHGSIKLTMQPAWQAVSRTSVRCHGFARADRSHLQI